MKGCRQCLAMKALQSCLEAVPREHLEALELGQQISDLHD